MFSKLETDQNMDLLRSHTGVGGGVIVSTYQHQEYHRKISIPRLVNLS